AVARELGPNVLAIPGDVTDPRHRYAIAAAVGDRLDLLVLNASALGPSPLPPLGELGTAELREVLETNVVAPHALVRLLLPALRAATGRVLALSSDAAVAAYPGWGGYGASKAALDQLTAVHGAAFPGEDISDRPEPATVVPAIRRLIHGDLPNGRYEAATLLGPDD